jgi:heme/copper-type cytochrome/quinol oxidase subunit 4
MLILSIILTIFAFVVASAAPKPSSEIFGVLMAIAALPFLAAWYLFIGAIAKAIFKTVARAEKDGF